MGVQAETQRLGLSTAEMAHRIMQARVQPWETFEDNAGRVFRRNTTTGKVELVTGQLKPGEQFVTHTDEFDRTIKTNVLTGEQIQVSGAPPTPPLTIEERIRLKKVPTDIPRGDYWSNPTTGDIQWVDSGVNPPEGYTKKVPETQIREVSDLPRKRYELSVERAVAAAEQKVNLHYKKEAIRPDVDFVNRNSVGTTGYVWVEEGWRWKGLLPDVPVSEAMRVDLPKLEGKQLTMEDVRAEAATRRISIEEVLTEIYAAMQEK